MTLIYENMSADDAYVKLVKPVRKRNWAKRNQRLLRDEKINSNAIKFAIGVILLAFIIISINFPSTHNPMTTEPNDVYAEFGDSGFVVYSVQDELAEYGYTILVDGKFGPQTQRAIALWQNANGLPITRVIDTMTLESLNIDLEQ